VRAALAIAAILAVRTAPFLITAIRIDGTARLPAPLRLAAVVLTALVRIAARIAAANLAREAAVVSAAFLTRRAAIVAAAFIARGVAAAAVAALDPFLAAHPGQAALPPRRATAEQAAFRVRLTAEVPAALSTHRTTSPSRFLFPCCNCHPWRSLIPLGPTRLDDNGRTTTFKRWRS